MPSSRTTRTGTHYAAARSTQGPPTQAMHHNSPSSGCVMMGITSFIDAAFPPSSRPSPSPTFPPFIAFFPLPLTFSVAASRLVDITADAMQ